MSERLQTTIDHFKVGILAMSMAAARYRIESWKTELEASDAKPLQSIATDLGQLHGELSNAIDGGKVAKLLSKLGEATNTVAPLAEEKRSLVLQLGKQLEKAGDKISNT